jgi:hypothetical protein
MAPAVAPGIVKDDHEGVAGALLLAGDVRRSHRFEIFFAIKTDDFRFLAGLGVDSILEPLL